MLHEYAFEMAASCVRFGAGVTREVGMDLVDLGVRRALVVTDPRLVSGTPVQTVLSSLKDAGVDAILYDRVRVEPTDVSFKRRDSFAAAQAIDGIVAVGGGSVIDTAKAVNLYTTYPPADFLDYVNAPIGKAMPVPGPLKPLIAIPTTAGTGSETTGVSIFDLTEMHAKTGIASRRLKPTLGLLDPDNTRTMPPQVAASSGLDILSHAIESFTALPYLARPRPRSPRASAGVSGIEPDQRHLGAAGAADRREYLVRAVEDPGDDEARAQMILAASYAGVGFGNAGVHLPHGMSYPVSGQVKSVSARPAIPTTTRWCPHGISVILNAPAVFRFTASANPAVICRRPRRSALTCRGAKDADAGRDSRRSASRGSWNGCDVPNGLKAIGYTSSDIPALVEGTLPQHRVTKLSPRPAGPDELAALFEEAMTAW